MNIEFIDLGGGLIMGAFCVYGISHSICKANAAKKVAPYETVDGERRYFTPAEWAARRDALADQLFGDGKRPVKVSPEFDAPQFCADWLGTNPAQVRNPVVMVRGIKRDKHGHVVKKNGAEVETWLNYSAECERLGIKET
jgi:hypothetical protein